MTDRRILAGVALGAAALGYAGWRVRKLELAWWRVTNEVRAVKRQLSEAGERHDGHTRAMAEVRQRLAELEGHPVSAVGQRLAAVEQHLRDANAAAAEHDGAHAELMVRVADHLASHAQHDAGYADFPAILRRLDALDSKARRLEGESADRISREGSQDA